MLNVRSTHLNVDNRLVHPLSIVFHGFVEVRVFMYSYALFRLVINLVHGLAHVTFKALRVFISL